MCVCIVLYCVITCYVASKACPAFQIDKLFPCESHLLLEVEQAHAFVLGHDALHHALPAPL